MSKWIKVRDAKNNTDVVIYAPNYTFIKDREGRRMHKCDAVCIHSQDYQTPGFFISLEDDFDAIVKLLMGR